MEASFELTRSFMAAIADFKDASCMDVEKTRVLCTNFSNAYNRSVSTEKCKQAGAFKKVIENHALTLSSASHAIMVSKEMILGPKALAGMAESTAMMINMYVGETKDGQSLSHLYEPLTKQALAVIPITVLESEGLVARLGRATEKIKPAKT